MSKILEQSAAPGSEREGTGWIVASGLAIGWILLWGFGLGPAAPISGNDMSGAPSVSFLPEPESGSGSVALASDVRALWSPSVFSLPSVVGFSRAALTNGIGARPPLQVPGGASVFLARPARSAVDFGAQGVPVLEPSVQEVLAGFPVRLLEAPVFGALAATGPAVRMELSSGLEESLLTTRDVPPDDVLLRDRPWDAVAYVEFNREGKVSAVFLETKSSFEDVDAALIHALRRWRVGDTNEPASGRVVFRSPGRSQIAGGPQNAGGP